MRNAPAGFTCSLERRVDELDRFRKALTAYLTSAGVGKSLVHHLELCAYEITANIIEHAGAAKKNDTITVKCAVSRKTVSCMFSYRGPCFDLNSVEDVDIQRHFNEGKDSGLGIHIVKTLVDRVESHYDGGINTVTFTVTRRSGKIPKKPKR